MIGHTHSRMRGFVSIELIFALIVVSLMTAIGINVASNWSASQSYLVAAQQQQTVAEAASRYLKDNFIAVSNAANAAPVQVTVPMLRNAGYLAAGFSDNNAFGQTFLALARKSGSTQLESIVITTGGESIDEIGTREIAENLGGTGGFVPVATPTTVQGTRGGWQVNLTNFGINPGAGHTASALFLLDGTLANDYLYRNFIAGKPELNRMNTGLDMGANNVTNANNITGSGEIKGDTLKSDDRTEVGEYIDLQSEEVEGTACEKIGLVSKTESGLLLSCQKIGTTTIWTASRGGAFGGAFMISLNSKSCAAPNPVTGDCNCPRGFSPTSSGWIGVSADTYQSGECIVDAKFVGTYTTQNVVQVFIAPQKPTTTTSSCRTGTPNTQPGCTCPIGSIPVPQLAKVTNYTDSINGIIDIRTERIEYWCISRA
ncbi:shufflon protein, N-terminal constant region [Pseudomonas asturiensis]|uniref:Shufflon protein, N-terminal constant region n=1 Tax=Pseudomonas asturiensis TaxID=1190415 RepID=A0A1M7P7P1_9PSED|nr:shufflon system plasmid conjugative transfer pilus tip adhesin PilV [Pseudomonas asturiensis]SHN12655.1 shufflon protein, N-terminal constant region [Pseudomonas asturiensis]